LFIHSSIGGHLFNFHLLEMLNSTEMDMHAHLFEYSHAL
jgi:hypothetical protein